VDVGAGDPASTPFVSCKVEQDFSYPGVHVFPMVMFQALPFDVNIEGTVAARLVAMAGQAYLTVR
jgi:hypothetical protein